MAFSTKLKLINAKMEQPSGGTLTLSGDTTVADSGDLRYETHPTFVDDEQIIDKKYVDDNVVSGSVYDLESPSTVTVGGLDAGSVITGLTSNEILEDILVKYLTPTFSSFGISGEPTIVEVGTSISGSKPFNWGTTNDENVAVNSIVIRDVTGGGTIATGLANDGAENVGITTKNFTTYDQVQSWSGEATDTLSAGFVSSNFTIRSYYPYYSGKIVGAGSIGDNRPTISQAIILAGTEVINSSSGSITITFGSASNEYIWFAIPIDGGIKDTWYETVFNNGDIGGAATTGPTDIGPNLFPAATIVSVTKVSPSWGPRNYYVYLSNWQGEVGTLQLS